MFYLVLYFSFYVLKSNVAFWLWISKWTSHLVAEQLSRAPGSVAAQWLLPAFPSGLRLQPDRKATSTVPAATSACHRFIFISCHELSDSNHDSQPASKPASRGSWRGPAVPQPQPSAMTPRRAAHELPADKWADKPSHHYSFPSWGSRGGEGGNFDGRKMGGRKKNGRAIFSAAVTCSISLRLYNGEKGWEVFRRRAGGTEWPRWR